MKTFKNVLLMFMIGLAVTACKKDDDGGDGGGAASGTISANVSGVGDFSSTTQLTSGTSQTANGVAVLQLTGSDNNGRNITIVINGYDGTGSYDIGGSNSVFVIATYIEANASDPQNSQIWTAPYDTSVAGEINISEASTTNVKGTFNFEGKNNNDQSLKNITNGSFDINLQ